MKMKSILISLMTLIAILPLSANAWSVTVTTLSQANLQLSKLQTLQSQAPASQKNQYQVCINQLTQYRDQVKNALVGLGTAPSQMPVCNVSAVVSSPTVPITITAPATVPIPAGKIGTFNVSFGGTGVAGATLQATTGLSASMKIIGQSSGTSTAAISVTPANGYTGGTITLLLTNSNKAVLKSQQIRVTVTPATTTTSAATATIGNLNIAPPIGTVSLSAGKSGTFPVSFSGTGIDRVAVQASGTGLSASVASPGIKPYPTVCTATVTIIAASNFQGGTVTFSLINNSKGVIQQKAIPIPVNIQQTPISLTSVGVDRNSATTNDTFNFRATTNIAASKVVVIPFIGTNTEHPMTKTSTDGQNWSLSLKGSSLGTGNNIPIVIRAYVPTGGWAQNTTLKVTVTPLQNTATNNTTGTTSNSLKAIAQANDAINWAKLMMQNQYKGTCLSCDNTTTKSGYCYTYKKGGYTVNALVDECCLNFATNAYNYNSGSHIDPVCDDRGQCNTAKELEDTRRNKGHLHVDSNPPIGALVFFSTYPNHHVGIYLGNQQYISALPGGIQVNSLKSLPYDGWAYPDPNMK